MIEIEIAILLVSFATLAVDVGIWYYVRAEYLESKELNEKLQRVYKAKKKKVNADRLVKAVITQEAQQS